MKKYRILIRAFTCRRDVAPMLPLKMILEEMGCEVIISGVRDFQATLRLWKPDAIIINVISVLKLIKGINSSTKIVYFDGEGFQMPGQTIAQWWAKYPEQYNELDLILVWGQQILKECHEYCGHLDLSKVHVVGNPKLDLVRFMTNNIKENEDNNSIGAVARFPTINDHQGIQPVRTLANQGNLERVIDQCNGFVGMIDSIRAILKNTDYKVSIRPHPNEQIESYHEYIEFWFGKDSASRVEIDDSLFFPEWAVQQKALISPTSTSFLEAYLLGVPVVNLDVICNTMEHNRDYAPVTAEWQSGSVMPENTDELCQLLKGELTVNKAPAIEKQLIEYCDWQNTRPASIRAADVIYKFMNEQTLSKNIHWPKWLIRLRDKISFYRCMKRNPLHHNFNYHSGFHKLPNYLNDMVNKMLKAG